MERIKELVRWLWSGRHGATAAIVVAGAIAVCGIRPTEPTIRITGLVLQLLGIGTVAWGISETRALFGMPPWSAQVRDWVSRFPRGKKTYAMHAGSGAIEIGGGNAGFEVVSDPGEGAAIEERVKGLAKDVVALRGRVRAMEHGLPEEVGKLERAIREEAGVRSTEDQALAKLLTAAQTGGVHITAIGALWLFVGVSLSTAGIEIEKLLR